MDKLQSKSVILKVMDQDRFSRDDPIGELVLPLAEFSFDDAYAIWKELKECTDHVRKLVSQKNAPTAARIMRPTVVAMIKLLNRGSY